MTLVQVALGSRTLTYNAPDSVAIGDAVEVPPFPWSDEDSRPIGRIVAIGSEYVGDVRSIRGVVPEEEAQAIYAASAARRAEAEEARKQRRCTATVQAGTRCTREGSPYRLEGGEFIRTDVILCDLHHRLAALGDRQCKALMRSTGARCTRINRADTGYQWCFWHQTEWSRRGPEETKR